MDKTDMIYDLVRNMDTKLDEVVESQIKTEADLRYHIKRTNMLETEIGRKFTQPSLKQISIGLGIISTLVGLGITLYKVVG